MEPPRAHQGTVAAAVAASILAGWLTGCESGAPQSGPAPDPATTGRAYDPEWNATQKRRRPGRAPREAPRLQQRKVHAQPTAPIVPSPDDPLKGRWTLADALSGLPLGERLIATLHTSMGNISCELWPDKAPVTVANFVGLARGLRPWKTPDGTWKRKPAYDGTSFHRVIKGFAIQGGSPTGRLDAGPGYAIPDEIWEDANHDRAGLLCLATTGKNTGGMQFLITDGPALQLDGGFPIFGSCGPVERIHAIASAKVSRGHPKRAITIETVHVARVQRQPPPPAATSSAAAARDKPPDK